VVITSSISSTKISVAEAGVIFAQKKEIQQSLGNALSICLRGLSYLYLAF
jgi:hypothetical protein